MNNSRLYLQYVPTGPGRQPLLDLQTAAHAVAGGTALPALELHMTLLHIGILNELWGELRRDHPALTLDDVLTEMAGFTSRALPLMPPRIYMQPLRYDRFGSHRDVLVLRLALTDDFQRLHAACAELLVDSLGRLLRVGPAAVRDFMRQSPNLRFSLEPHPHITLLRAADVRPDLPVVQAGPILLQRTAPDHNLKDHL